MTYKLPANCATAQPLHPWKEEEELLGWVWYPQVGICVSPSFQFAVERPSAEGRMWMWLLDCGLQAPPEHVLHP